MLALGLDIGTTKICGIVVDTEDGRIVAASDHLNDTFLPSANEWEKIQSPSAIWDICNDIVSTLTASHAISCIGVTGQMHGIVYFDKDFAPVSPLAIWQDGRGDLPYESSTYAKVLSQSTGYAMATGFGLTTHFYNTKNGLVPSKAAGVCTIHDYVAAKLCGLTKPVMHTSDAASFGLFDPIAGRFDTAKFAACGMDTSLLPEVVGDPKVIGRTSAGIPVCTAIGDNQASFLGSVSDMENTALVNIGTGSQISVFSHSAKAQGELEARPLFDQNFILVGCALCGGRAYALLERFFSAVVEMATGQKPAELYGKMAAEAAKVEHLTCDLNFTTFFSGTRHCPEKRAEVSNLGEENFKPSHFIVGVLSGMADELYTYYKAADAVGASAKRLVGSGNGIRKNPLLQEILAKKFNMPLFIPAHTEEAAYGAAIWSMAGTGIKKSLTEAQSIIAYTKTKGI